MTIEWKIVFVKDNTVICAGCGRVADPPDAYIRRRDPRFNGPALYCAPCHDRIEAGEPDPSAPTRPAPP